MLNPKKSRYKALENLGHNAKTKSTNNKNRGRKKKPKPKANKVKTNSQKKFSTSKEEVAYQSINI